MNNTPAASRTTAAERAVREFARQFPTPNVLVAVRHCEAGRLAWEQLEALCARSLATALDEVRSAE